MRIIHTSDWHIGKSLHGRKRYEEFEAFFLWLAETIVQRQADALVIAGDIFDTGAPSTRAQELYYQFLVQAARSGCRHVVVVGGNHDSPRFLEAPKELLKLLNVHVVGCTGETLREEVLLLKDQHGAPEMVLCAVPFLRDKDLRDVEAGESPEDKERKLVEGIQRHYAQVIDEAKGLMATLDREVPLVATGHLFTRGGVTNDDDGVRDLYVGSLAYVGTEAFGVGFDYVALGHLHMAQKVQGSDFIRYSGSPLPMSFSEAAHKKSLLLVEFQGRTPTVEALPVPSFRQLESVRGDWAEISLRLQQLAALNQGHWVEVIFEGNEIVGSLRDEVEKLVSGSTLEVLRVKDSRVTNRVLSQMHAQETLEDLSDLDVFLRCLDANSTPEEQRPQLLATYQEALASLNNPENVAE